MNNDVTCHMLHVTNMTSHKHCVYREHVPMNNLLITKVTYPAALATLPETTTSCNIQFPSHTDWTFFFKILSLVTEYARSGSEEAEFTKIVLT